MLWELNLKKTHVIYPFPKDLELEKECDELIQLTQENSLIISLM